MKTIDEAAAELAHKVRTGWADLVDGRPRAHHDLTIEQASDLIAAAMREREEAAWAKGYDEGQFYEATMNAHSGVACPQCGYDGPLQCVDGSCAQCGSAQPHAEAEASEGWSLRAAENFAIPTAIEALRYFVTYGEVPAGGNSKFNAEHCAMIAMELENLLARAPRGGSDQETPLEKHYRSEIEMWKDDIDETRRRAEAAEAERDALKGELAKLQDPAAVWINMLKGKIARPRALEHYEELKARVEKLEVALLRAEKPEAPQ